MIDGLAKIKGFVLTFSVGLIVSFIITFSSPIFLSLFTFVICILYVLLKRGRIPIIDFFILSFFIVVITYYILDVSQHDSIKAIQWYIAYIIITCFGFIYLIQGDMSNFKNPLVIFFIVYSVYFIVGFFMWIVWEFLFPVPELPLFRFDSDPLTVILVGYLSLYTIVIAGEIGSYLASKWKVKTITYSNKNMNKTYLELLSWFILIAGFISAYILFAGFREAPLLAAEAKDMVRLEVVRRSSGFTWVFYMLLILMPSIVYLKANGKFKSIGIIDILKVILSLTILSLYAGRFFMLSPIMIVLLLHMHNYSHKISLLKIGFIMLLVIIFSIYFIGYRIYGTEVNIDLAIRAFFVDFFPEVRMFAAAVTRVAQHEYLDNVLTTIAMGFVPSKMAEIVGLDKSRLWQPIGGYVSQLFSELGGELGIRLSWIGEWYIAGGLPAVIGATFISAFIVGWLNYKLTTRKELALQYKFKYIIIIFLIIMTIPYGTLFIVTIGWLSIIIFLLFTVIPYFLNQSLNFSRANKCIER